MKKVIFLDIDGVLNSDSWNNSHQNEINQGILVDKEKIRLLGILINDTDAKVTLHSGWKFWFDCDLNPLRKEAEILKNLLEIEGIYMEGLTPDYTTEEIRRTKKFGLVKANEILGWLEEHNDVREWIVIDDLDLQNEEIEKHQIRTCACVGLTMDDIQQGKKLLISNFSL